MEVRTVVLMVIQTFMGCHRVNRSLDRVSSLRGTNYIFINNLDELES